jgi:uncharacterized protein (DUF2141 family)
MKRRLVGSILILLSFLYPELILSQEITTEVTGAEVSSFTLEISGIEKTEGEIRIAVFDSKEHYTKETIHAVVLPVEGSSIEWSVPDLPFGEYAIAVYHDKNTNGKLDTNLLGIPKERYGFSNNARGRFGPASWGDAKFEVNQKEVIHQIEIK